MKKTRKLMMAASALLSGALVLGCAAEAQVQVKSPKPAPKAQEPPPPPEAPKPEYITIRDRIEFQSGKAALLPQSLPVLDEVADVLNANDHIHRVEIEGHTDATGRADLNFLLSQSRAETVRDYLVTKHGIDRSRLVPKGYGQETPVADNTTSEGRQQNRRVEFRITDQDGTKLSSNKLASN